MRVLDQDLKEAQSKHEEDIELFLLFIIGDTNQTIGDLLEARKIYTEMETKAKNLRDNFLHALASFSLGKVLLQQGFFPDALEKQKKALELYTAEKNDHGIACTLGEVGTILSHLGSYQESIEYQEKSLEKFKQLKDQVNEAISLESLAVLNLRLDDYDRAISYLNQAIQIYRKFGKKSASFRDLEGTAYYNLGGAYLGKKDFTNAARNYDRAVSVFQETKNKMKIFETTVLYLRMLSFLPQKDEAISSLEGLLKKVHETDHPSLKAYIFWSIGRIFMRMSKHDDALKNLQEAKRIYSDIGEMDFLPHCIQAIGEENESLGNEIEAVRNYSEALRLYNQIVKNINPGTKLEANYKERFEDLPKMLRKVFNLYKQNVLLQTPLLFQPLFKLAIELNENVQKNQVLYEIAPFVTEKIEEMKQQLETITRNFNQNQDLLQKIFIQDNFESNHLDFKRKLSLNEDEAKAEFLKDCLALINTPPNMVFENKSYLCIGFGEKNGRWDGTCQPIKDVALLEKKIVDAVANFIRPRLNTQLNRLRLIDYNIFSPDPSIKWSDTDECAIIELNRKSKTVYELAKDIGGYIESQSWYRSASHAKVITQEMREFLLEN